ncbi:MAG: hypothetical protein Kow0077_08170 [Anaerolineae bacterium]
MRRLSPYLIMGLLIVAPFLLVSLSAVHAEPPRQEDDGAQVTPETDFATFVRNIRFDLELLADEVNGPGVRPAGHNWTGNDDPTSATILSDIWVDLEAQADEVFEEEFGEGGRPLDWAGVATAEPNRIARNLRHDLELLANYAFGEDERPEDWIGALPIFSCDLVTQNLIDAVGSTFEFTPTTSGSVVNYCQAVAGEALDQLAGQGITLVQDDVPKLLENIRGDLERLADEMLGLDVRPPEYRRTLTIESNQMAADLLHDLELLADELLGPDNRPPNWIGSIGRSPGIYVRNLRHDLELLADIVLEGREDHLIEGRPEGWNGVQGFGDDLTFCPTAVQGLVMLLQQYYRYELPTVSAENQELFCRTVGQDASAYWETGPEQVTFEELAGFVGASGRPLAESDWAFAYLDVAALQYMGIMPKGTPFEAWYRNFGDSTMMYVVGQDFALYVSQRWTTLPEEVFYRLPTLDGVIPETYCFAAWCSGPGPTPTPTGQVPTPTPGAAPGGPPPGLENLVLVPWNQINVYYDQDRPETGTVYVRLELCAAVGVGCEPVQNAYDAAGNPLPIINVIGPYPVFELPYGYSNAYILTSTSYYANEVWISDPTLRGITTGQ